MGFTLYDHRYKRLMLLPLIVGIAALIIVFIYPGVTLGLDFAGGTRVVVNTDLLQEQPVKDLLSSELGLPEVKVQIVSSPLGTNARIEYAEPRPLAEARVLLDRAAQAQEDNPTQAEGLLREALLKLNRTPSSSGVDALIVETAQAINEESQSIADAVRESLTLRFGLPASTSFTVEEVTPTFGASFLGNALFVGLISIILLTIVIFIFFREWVPSLAVVEAALFDMLIAVALATLFGFSFTLAAVAALLMLIGYSVDTDILLTTRILKRKDKDVFARANDTLITGLTVTGTLFGAALVMLIVSWYAQITTIFEIAAIVLFGMIGDLIATWFTNAPILLWYWEKKHGKVSA
ncbi:MAG: hypothetical protein Q8P05_05085 [Candidatus Diapherotrites archaeon]|nr:hypothetical protein [Candidatus Diapherotrites archaeon]